MIGSDPFHAVLSIRIGFECVMNDKRAIGRIYRMRIVWKIIRIQAKLWALQAVNNTEI